jgi:hypothetical protein
MFKLKESSEAFTMVDGPMTGQEFIRGKNYEKIPEMYAGKFELVPEESAEDEKEK